MDAVTKNIEKPRGRKKSFNFEADVESDWDGWKSRNPMIIESRVINQALREWLAKQVTKKAKAA